MENWTIEEIEYLKRYYEKSSRNNLAEQLNRSVDELKKKAFDLGIISRIRNDWTDEEIEFLKQNYQHLSKKEIANKINKSFYTVCRKGSELGLTSNKKIHLSFTEDELWQSVKESFSISEVAENLGLSKSGSSFKVIKKYIEYYGIDTSHFDRYKKLRERVKTLTKSYPIESWLKEGTSIGSSKLKEKLYHENLKERKCELCGQGEEWNGMNISLILDHINGINDDNRLENLRIVCPNCNAGLPTHCKGVGQSKRVNRVTMKSKQRQQNNGLTEKEKQDKIKQRKTQRPPYEQLKKDIEEHGYLATGRKYGVSDNAVRKWVKWYEKYG